MITEQAIAERVRLGRKELGLSQEELAERAHVSRPTIARIEQGKVNSVSFGALQRILVETNWDLSLERGVITPTQTNSFDMEAYLDSLFGDSR